MTFFKSETQTDCGGKGRSMDPTWSFEGKPIKIVSDKNGKQWFFGRDVCVMLGFRNIKQTLFKQVKHAYKSPLRVLCETRTVPLTQNKTKAVYISRPGYRG